MCGDGRISNWVGIEAFTIDGQVKTFLHYQNLNGNLTLPQGRESIARDIVGLKMNYDIDAAIRPSIRSIDKGTNTIEIGTNPAEVGLYIEVSKRGGMVHHSLLRRVPESDLEYKRAYQGALDMMPVVQP